MAKEYKTKRLGLTINLDQIMEEQGNQPAAGNMNVNARGDQIDSQGNVIRTRREIAQQYHKHNDAAVKRVSVHQSKPESQKTSKPTNKQDESKAREQQNTQQKSVKERSEEIQQAATKEKVEAGKEDNIKPTSQEGVYEKLTDSGNIIHVDEKGTPLRTQEMLDDPDAEEVG